MQYTGHTAAKQTHNNPFRDAVGYKQKAYSLSTLISSTCMSASKLQAKYLLICPQDDVCEERRVGHGVPHAKVGSPTPRGIFCQGMPP